MGNTTVHYMRGSVIRLVIAVDTAEYDLLL